MPPKLAVLDTNLLLLWLVGLVDPTLLLTFKRVNIFTTEDLTTLAELLLGFQAVVTTPHVLTEVSNFTDQTPPHRRPEMKSQLRRFAQECAEIYHASAGLVLRPEFDPLGLADTALSSLSSTTTVITVDRHLAARIALGGGRVINFNHYRSVDVLD